jgi:hypothetical protein
MTRPIVLRCLGEDLGIASLAFGILMLILQRQAASKVPG